MSSIQGASVLVRDVLVLFRWQFWAVSLIPVLIGYSMSPQGLEWARIAILLVIFGPCLEGAAEAINDYFDVNTDRPEMVKKIAGVQLSGGTGLLQTGIFARSTVLALSLFAYATSLILSVCFFATPFFLTVVAGTFLGIGYSAPPFRFKARGFLGPLSVGVSFGCVTLLGGFTASGTFPHGPTILRMLPLVLTVTGLFLTHQIVDYEADMNASVRTFCVRHGIRATRFLSGFLILVGAFMVLPLPRHSPSTWPAVVLVLVGLAWILTALARGRITPLVRVIAVVLEATVALLCLV
jgi:chlorophyll synthase